MSTEVSNQPTKISPRQNPGGSGSGTPESEPNHIAPVPLRAVVRAVIHSLSPSVKSSRKIPPPRKAKTPLVHSRKFAHLVALKLRPKPVPLCLDTEVSSCEGHRLLRKAARRHGTRRESGDPSTTPEERQISERGERSMNLPVLTIDFPLEVTISKVYFHCLQCYDSRNYHFEKRKSVP